jgi:hypothetical protein
MQTLTCGNRPTFLNANRSIPPGTCNDGRDRSIAPNFTQSRWLRRPGSQPHLDSTRNPTLRIADVEIECVDASIVVPNGVGSFCLVEVDLELARLEVVHPH